MRRLLRRPSDRAWARRAWPVLLSGLAIAVITSLALGFGVASRAGAVSAVLPAGGGAATTQARHAADAVSGSVAHSSASTVARRKAPRVRRPAHLIQGTLLARQDHPLTAAQISAVKAVAGVDRVAVVSLGSAHVDHYRAHVLSGDPAVLRPWTPRLTADSAPLWSSIAAGEITVSFDMGHQAKLPLGHTVPVAAQHRDPLRVGAFATVGMAGVDAVVDGKAGRSLGLPQRNALIISAPHADPLTLRSAVDGVLDAGAGSTLLRQVVVVRDSGEFMSRAQITSMLRAAESRLGKPYVWGATGPNSFDCSGLVQWSFARAGIIMPRVAADQFLTGPRVPFSQARPGDLLFWHYDPTDPTYVDHVAIYIGNGQMIAAPHTGLDVEVEPVPLDHMAGVVRVDPGVATQVGG